MKIPLQKIQIVFTPLFSKAFRGFQKVQPWLRKKQPLLITLGLAFLISDLLILKSHKLILPEKTLPPLKLPAHSRSALSKNYEMIWKKNIFHPGPIPTSLIADESPSDMTPVKTSLPFTLKGTIVHANPHRSVATVKSGKETLSYKMGNTIDNQAKITEILRGRILFINQNNNLLEFLELPESTPVTLSFNKPRRQDLVKASLVKRKGNTFEVKRSLITEYMQKLPEILRQAKMVPHRVMRNGEMVIEGWRFTSIDKDALWLKELDFQKNDIIKQVDGEPVNDAETAVMFYKKFKDSDGFEMTVERNGKKMTRKYTVDWDAQ